MKQQLVIDRYNKGQDRYFSEYSPIDDELHCKSIKLKIYGMGLNSWSIKINLYDFLFNPKWGWLDTFHKDKEWQKEFLKWLKRKKICDKDYDIEIKRTKLNSICIHIDLLPKKMLVGYIQEFMEQFK